MKKIFQNSFDITLGALFGLGFLIFILTISDTIISFKPAIEYNGSLDEEVKSGDHIKGEIVISYGTFVPEDEVVIYSTSKKIKCKDTSYYYVIPGMNEDSYIGIRVDQEDNEDMVKIVNDSENLTQKNGYGTVKGMKFEGRVVKLKSRVKENFIEWLLDKGYTQEEVDNMGDFYIIEPRAFGFINILNMTGVIMMFSAVIFYWYDHSDSHNYGYCDSKYVKYDNGHGIIGGGADYRKNKGDKVRDDFDW